MSCGLETVTPAGPVFRLARAPEPWAWPDWSQAGQDGTFGNRWDDPLGSYRVLYPSTTRFGTLIETLAPFRPDLEVVAGLHEVEGGEEAVAAGTVPREWFAHRLMGVAELVGTYADIGAAATPRGCGCLSSGWPTPARPRDGRRALGRSRRRAWPRASSARRPRRGRLGGTR